MLKWQPAKTSSAKRANKQLQLGDELDLEITDLNSKGEGVGKHMRQVLFVPGTWLGEHVRVRIVELKKSYVQAELVSILQASDSRRDVPCPYHGVTEKTCGGCPWMFIDYAAQIHAKQRRVEELCSRLDLDYPGAVQPSIQELAYRNRAQLKASADAVGFVAARSDQIVDVERCSVLSDHNNALLAKIREQDLGIGRRRKTWVTIDIADEVDFEHISFNQRLPFRQGNTAQNQEMLGWLTRVLGGLGSEQVVELFAGSGNLTQALVASGVDDITAVEVVPEALDALRQRLPSAKTFAHDLFDKTKLSDLVSLSIGADLLLLDPPRDGFALLGQLVSQLPSLKSIIYISCDLASFERDVASLRELFELRELQPLDMYPQTPHVELLSLWMRKT
ncbi:MAG: class I SAM-dependent RNA methyltransferase [Aequoribacter sp.]|jgi:23S rRNA (uracil1939-C5)-methyltransferase|uniref:class I SAM-dependent RNA methyltransferase n=1 Tax=Aequoribacter sp. TaxID=2847771 RepID=UPI003C31E43D